MPNLFQEALGDVVYAQLPEVDEDVEAGVDCGALESVKVRVEMAINICFQLFYFSKQLLLLLDDICVTAFLL